MQTFRTFYTVPQARDYRHDNGTGGWIFEPDHPGESILFPPDMMPAHIFSHPFVRGQSGKLIGK